jgi:hypothetical protein
MTIKHILASSALATLLAGGALAQTTPAADPAIEPAAPMAEPAAPLANDADGAAAPMTDSTDPVVVEDDANPDASAPMTGETDWAPVDLASFSTDRLIGADIVTGDDETVATIEDVVINDDGMVENVVAKFGGFLGFGSNQVLLTMDEIEVMQDADENLLVRTSLTPESIESRPVYE